MATNDNENFEPLVVLQLSSTTPTATKQWIIQRLTAKHDDDEGAGLLARFETNPEDNQENIIVIGATIRRLLGGAEELRLKKLMKDKTLTEFLFTDIDRFENSENRETFLLKSEKQRIIWEEIQNLHPMKHEHAVPGVPTQSISPANDTILSILRKLDFLENIFPLHDAEDIKLIERDWFKSKNSFFKAQDIHKVRNYFGESVAFYFAFMEYYTKSLVPTTIMGILISFLPSSDFFKYSFFALFNVVWWTIVMERWKRLTNKLASQWGTFDVQIYQRARPLYYGDLKLSPITNKPERIYPPWKRMIKKYLVSYPIIIGCIALSLTIYFKYYRIQHNINENYPIEESSYSIKSKVMRMIPSIGYSLVLITSKLIYKKVATYLTEFENHRLQTVFENNLTAKLFIFYFVNSFVGLFYEAFFNASYGTVAQLLTTLVIVNAIILKFTEQIGPYIFKNIKKKQLEQRGSSAYKVSDVIKQTRILTPFEGTYADYLTVFEQFGFCALFSAVYPWITICALINNIFELRADAFKYCYVYQRPFAQPVANIGSWHYAFDILSSVSIVTNTALIAMQPSVRDYFSSYSDLEYVLLFVAAEHVLLALKFAIDFAIPDVPYDVVIARAKNLYESNQALRRERERRAAHT